MTTHDRPGRDCQDRHGFLVANRWLLARRLCQLGIFLLFATGPWLGVWIAKGNLATSLTFDVLPLTDPLVLLQSLVARHLPELTAVVGAGIVLATYLTVGGRLYCSWVCPINVVTDTAAWLRRRLGIETDWKVKPETRLWVLGAILFASAITGTIAFELVNPITTLYRNILFGMSWGLASIAAIFAFDLLVAKHGWCGHVCPVGAFYGVLNHTALVRVSAPGRARCDDCMDCYAVCPEMHVISPALKGDRTGASPVILSADCTACGRCVDVCPERVFKFTHRFDQKLDAPTPSKVAEQKQPALAA